MASIGKLAVTAPDSRTEHMQYSM